jgi:hypothetical protein
MIETLGNLLGGLGAADAADIVLRLPNDELLRRDAI